MIPQPDAAAQEGEQTEALLSAPLPVMQGPGRVFRTAFWSTAAKLTLGYTVFALLLALLLSGTSSSRLRLLLFLLVPAFSVLDGLFVSGVMALFYPSRVSADGISGYTQWGTRRFIAWREIMGAKPVNILTFRYLRIWGDGSIWALWLPLFLKDAEGVRTTVLEFAPTGSPIRAFFES